MKKTIDRTPEGLRVIQTARTEKAINKAAKAGFRPLVRPVTPSDELYQECCVWQNLLTGEIELVGDLRWWKPSEASVMVIDWKRYYPYQFPEPFAAYLIPADIQTGERVWVADLIEDYVGMVWPQGGVSRLESCEAVWDGVDLKIDYNPEKHRTECVG